MGRLISLDTLHQFKARHFALSRSVCLILFVASTYAQVCVVFIAFSFFTAHCMLARYIICYRYVNSVCRL